MSLKSDIFDAIKGLVALRCYPDRFPQEQSPTWPAIRVTFAGGTVYEDLDGDGGEQADDLRIQLDWVGRTEAERDALTPLIRAAMNTIATPCRLQGPPICTFDAETKTYRATADWIAHQST